jgi:L-ascorbate metabolism protein UlaG (beta-lactamase superfamily)
VDILLVPVGGHGSLTPAKASEVISLFEPSLVVPMNYKVKGLTVQLGTLSPFLKEMGLEKPEVEETLKVGKTGLSEETRVVVLQPRGRSEG